MDTKIDRSMGRKLAACFGFFTVLAGCGSAPEGATSQQSEPERAAIRETTLSAPVAQRSPTDPPTPRPTTKEACDACHGLWDVHGIEPVESCICKTSDEGRECLDGKDCQGECLVDGDAEFHAMDQSQPPRGFFKGHCAAYDATFGCFRHLADDVQLQLPLVAEEASEFICAD